MTLQNDNLSLTQKIKKLFNEEGFFKIGVSKIEELSEEKKHFQKWLAENRNADMAWLERSFEKRTNPTLIKEEFISIISAAYIYNTPLRHSDDPGTGKISRYAWGSLDYHKVLKKKLKVICKKMIFNDVYSACNISIIFFFSS